MLNTLARGLYLFLLAVMLVTYAMTAGRSEAAHPKANSATVYMFS